MAKIHKFWSGCRSHGEPGYGTMLDDTGIICSTQKTSSSLETSQPANKVICPDMKQVGQGITNVNTCPVLWDFNSNYLLLHILQNDEKWYLECHNSYLKCQL